MDILIRQIEISDIDGFYSAFSEVAREKKYLLTIKAPPLDSIKEFVERNIAGNYAQYVALIDGKVVGWADVSPSETETTTHVGKLGMGVLKNYRGIGVGSLLLEKTLSHAWASGLERIELEVHSDNIAALKLYENHRFLVEGVKRFARKIDGNYQDLVMMAQYRT